MNRRAFLTGLAGVAGAAAAVSLLPSQAQAIPLARTPADLLAEDAAERAASQARTPDGTVVEQAQYWRRRRRWRRRWRRRNSRLVCRRYWIRGRWRRRCHRVWWY